MNRDKDFYSKELLQGKAADYVGEILTFTEAWLERVADEFPKDSSIRVLDLGAGSCTTSLAISNLSIVKEIVAADVSAERMSSMSKETASIVNGHPEKLAFQEIDFNEALPFGDNEFEMVVMDAALHHSRNIWHTLSEIRRVLKPSGFFVAQREAYLATLTSGYAFKRLLKSPEVAAGVSENAYLKSQYDYYLRVNGFEPQFLPVYPSLFFRLAFFLNGIVYAKYNIVSRSTKGK